jgi:hypothetical protein
MQVGGDVHIGGSPAFEMVDSKRVEMNTAALGNLEAELM